MQTVDDLDRVHRGSPKPYWNSVRFLPVSIEAEQRNRAVRLPENRTANVHDLLQSFQLDRSINAQVRSCSGWQGSFKAHVHGHGPVLRGRVYTGYSTRYRSVTRIDLSNLSREDILRLSLGNLQLSFQLGWLRDLREDSACNDLLTLFDRCCGNGPELLQNAMNSRPNVQLIDLLLLQAVLCA